MLARNNRFDDSVGIPYPFDYELPSPEDIERMEEAKRAKKAEDLQDWLMILEVLSEFDDDSADVMVYDPRTGKELPLYIIERRTLANLRHITTVIAAGTSERWSDILEYFDWYFPSEIQLVTLVGVCDVQDGVLDEFDDDVLFEEYQRYKREEGPDEDIEFEIACAHRAFEYILEVYCWYYETEVLGLASDVDYTPSPYRRGGKGYRLR